MKKNESQKPISLEELLRGLRVQDEYQAKIISMQEETISLQNKQNEDCLLYTSDAADEL